MSDVYSDEYRAARGPDGPPMIPPGIRRAAGAALFLIVVIGMAVWAWRLGTRDATEVPIIRAMEGPARIQPADPGGLQASHQGLEVNSVLGGVPAPVPERDLAPSVMPPPVALQDEDGPQGELVLAVPDFPTVALPGAGEDLRMPMQEDAPELAGRLGEEPAPDPGAEVAALVAAALGEQAETADEAADAPAAAAAPRPRGRPSGHVVRAASTPASPPTEVRTAAASPAPSAARPAPAASGPAAPAEVTRLNPGTRLVQLGAFDSEAMARQTWSQLVGRHGDLLGAKSLYLERATHNARVFYRLRVAGFQNTDQTRVLCESLRARGVDCIPVTLN
jgi:cell division septation protein DedD